MATKAKTTAKKTETAAAKTESAVKETTKKVEAAMAEAGTKAKEFAQKGTEKMEEMIADAQTRAKEAADKAMTFAKDSAEFHKANLEAMVESGKIAAKGLQDLGKQNADYARENFEHASATAQSISSLKSPRDFFEMQSERTREAFDSYVSQASKNTEAMMKLASDAFKPIQTRWTDAVEAARKAA